PVEKSPHTRLRFTLWPGVGYSVFTFDQSHSSSSATSCARPVSVPCPISERAIRITTVSSGRMTTHAVTSGGPSCEATQLAPDGAHGQHHARLAVATLRDLLAEPGLLHLVQSPAAGEAFDGGDPLAFGGGDGHHAGADRGAIEVHRAGAALRDAAAVLGAGEADLLTDCPQEGRAGVDVDLERFAIDRQARHELPSRDCGAGKYPRSGL